jgi:hypothetical protein
MKINVRTVLDQAEKRKKEVKPLPKINIQRSETIPIATETSPNSKVDADRQALLDELQTDLVRVKKERAVLSSQNWKLVEAIEARLRAESPVAADAFLDGKLKLPELEEHVAKIEALTDRGAQIYDDMEYVRQHGKRPDQVDAIPTQETSSDAKAINYEIRRLDDRIHKTRKKLARGKAKNPLRIALWNQKIAFDEAQRDQLKHKLKKLQYESRTERTGQV